MQSTKLLLLSIMLLLLGAAPCRAANTLQAVGRFPEQLSDADRDGVSDLDDNCPATQATTLVRGRTWPTRVDQCGCPTDPCAADADRDGVGNCDDLCPATARGLRVTANGCPRPQKRPQTFVLDVKFAFAEANLQDRFVPDLDQLRVLLLRLPKLTVTLEGHTDAEGSSRYNQALSQARAAKCRSYLLSDPRIAPSRVKAVGYGERRPVADNGSAAGRSRNRRTVARLDYLYEFTPPNDGRGLPP